MTDHITTKTYCWGKVQRIFHYFFKPLNSYEKLNKLISQNSLAIFELFKSADASTAIAYKNGKLSGEFSNVFSHTGLYGFIIQKDGIRAIAYIGKTEGGQRIRQHLTGKNKNGKNLAKSVKTKFKKIREAIAAGFLVSVCLFSDNAFQKSSLSCLEKELALKARVDFAAIFPNIPHWNQRIG